MKSIEIKTTQNVVLQYELADLRERIMAFLLDLVCMTVGLSFLSAIGLPIFAGSEVAVVVYLIFLVCIFTFYSLAFEVLNNGQSIGKMAFRIRVIKTIGGKATFSDYAARWVFRMVDIYFSLGAIASILIASSARAQRIGDIVANTAVVRLSSNINLDLNDLLAIQSTESYKPSYLQARQLAEEDVLLIKSTLERVRRFNNPAHREALEMLAQRIKLILGLQDVPEDNSRFLQTILRDYIVLTR